VPARGLKCTACKATYSLSEKVLVCSKCGGVLDLVYDLSSVAEKSREEILVKRERSIWRYRELLPVDSGEFLISLGEGLTPLRKASQYSASIGLSNLALKLDFLNPTGSFKDRGTSVSVSNIKQIGIKAVLDDSSGNAGASLAAYCAAAQIACTLYVPASAPSEKLLQAEIYGAKVVKVAGSRTEVAEAAENAWRSSDLYYASHNLSPFFFDGMKTLAYEIAEDLGWQPPDHVIFPVGAGVLMAGAYKGFQDLVMLGWIDRVPKLHCVQSEACMPIVEAFQHQKGHVEATIEGETVAGGIRISNPRRGDQALQAIRASKGVAVAVTDEALLMHQRLLARTEGIFAEPTSCAALAGIAKLLEMSAIDPQDAVVVPLTGFGLKDSRTASRSQSKNLSEFAQH
jgi:threonine synthase